MQNYYKTVMKKSVIILTLMFGVLFAFATAIVWKLELPLFIGIGISVFIILFQFLIAPTIIEFLYNIEFDNAESCLEPEVLEFIQQTCKQNRIPIPKIGIIKDGNPNAFTYGHIPKDARLIVTTGILDILSEEEQKAVIAHEIGHIKHYDFIAMMIISIIPMIMYQIYISTKNNNKNNMVYWIGIGAYGVYIFSQLLVLSFSRIREYYADHFAKTVTNGTDLANALVKIAYGFTEIEKSKKPKVSSMAFTNNIQNEAFAMVQYKQMDMNELEEKLMKWDIQNIWGKFYEFWSTHPLTFKRILALKGKKIEKENNSAVYSIRFCIEAFISVLPWMTAGIILFIYESELASGFKMIDGGLEIIHNHPLSLVVLGISALIKYYYCYGNTFKQQSIYELLLRQDASPIKGIPAILEGKAIGKGIPGLFYSEDIVIDDETGILFIDYRLPLKILEFFFGMMKVDELKDRNVKVSGWYRRGIRPYFVCKHIIVGEEKIISYNYLLKQLLGYGLMIAGMIMWLF